ncbi:MAG TPA: hypothetical protein VM711_07955 [Sphingomicrobium sp.]|nr:hypothetical protein [Sphingomicrobium sp.]
MTNESNGFGDPVRIGALRGTTGSQLGRIYAYFLSIWIRLIAVLILRRPDGLS